MPSISFVEVTATLIATETEIQEHESAIAARNAAQTALTSAQDVVAGAQADLTTATQAESTEKADVVAGITQAISQLNDLLATLQV